jgi:hypothetical protein
MSYTTVPRLTLLLLAAGVTACGERASTLLEPSSATSALRSASSDAAALREVRRTTARYHDVHQALADGYAPPEPAACVEVPGLGAMGVHSLNLGLASDLAIDALRPEVLLYLPMRGGGFRLIGVEYVVVALVQTPAGPAPWFAEAAPPYPFLNPAPEIFGQTFDGPMAGHESGQPWHYDLHAWAWAPNPAGDFAQFNPSLSCASD